MNIKQLISFAELAKTGVFSESQITGMLQAAMGMSSEPAPKAYKTEPRYSTEPLKLSYTAALSAAIYGAHPEYEAPLWEVEGKPHTSVYGFIDGIKYCSKSGNMKFITELQRMGALHHSVGHFVDSDTGKLYLAKTQQRYETKFASVVDLTAAAKKVFSPRIFKRLVALGAS